MKGRYTMNRIIEVNNCWDCPYNRQGHYCDNEKTLNMDIGEYTTGDKGKIHPGCKLVLKKSFVQKVINRRAK